MEMKLLVNFTTTDKNLTILDSGCFHINLTCKLVNIKLSENLDQLNDSIINHIFNFGAQQKRTTIESYKKTTRYIIFFLCYNNQMISEKYENGNISILSVIN